jgi:uncharacterized membrane protein SpoIIM required for sporulation
VPVSNEAVQNLPAAYRRICQDLADAQARGYSVELVQELNQLVLRGHQFFYAQTRPAWREILQFILYGFPRLVRAEWRWISLAWLVTLVPALLVFFVIKIEPNLVYSLATHGQLAGYAEMYDPSGKHFTEARGAGADIGMFGFYIRNNVGIDFQTFASGLLGGIGSIFVLVYNGVQFAVVGGYLQGLGYGKTFWPFVVGHSSFEITAMVFAGAAGMKLGFAWFFPARRTRLAALKFASKNAIQLLYGAALMTFIAAWFEAFWSSSVLIPSEAKFFMGAFLWSGLTVYFVFAGRHYAN